jgi:hypothetical protein
MNGLSRSSALASEAAAAGAAPARPLPLLEHVDPAEVEVDHLPLSAVAMLPVKAAEVFVPNPSTLFIEESLPSLTLLIRDQAVDDQTRIRGLPCCGEARLLPLELGTATVLTIHVRLRSLHAGVVG